MSTISRRVCSVTILFLVGAFSAGVGRSGAADSPKELAPIPAQSWAEDDTQASVLQDESQYEYADDYEGTDFFGTPLCSPPGRVWLRADYLMWCTSGTNLPPLVTTSTQNTPRIEAGVLGLPNTTILYGNDTIANDGRSGFRTTIGMWLDSCRIWNLEFDYLSLGDRGNGYTATSIGDPILARPFFNVQTNQQASELAAYREFAEGTLSVSDALRVFTIRTLVAAKQTDLNKDIIRRIVRERKSNFLSTDYIL